MRSFVSIVEAADRLTATLCEAPESVMILTATATAARATGDFDSADSLDAAAQRLRDALAAVTLAGLWRAVESCPGGILEVIEAAGEKVNGTPPPR